MFREENYQKQTAAAVYNRGTESSGKVTYHSLLMAD
jgi:hypothetical protein